VRWFDNDDTGLCRKARCFCFFRPGGGVQQSGLGWGKDQRRFLSFGHDIFPSVIGMTWGSRYQSNIRMVLRQRPQRSPKKNDWKIKPSRPFFLHGEKLFPFVCSPAKTPNWGNSCQGYPLDGSFFSPFCFSAASSRIPVNTASTARMRITATGRAADNPYPWKRSKINTGTTLGW